MILRSRSGRKKRIKMKRLPVGLIGISANAFIANQGWVPNMRAAGCFNIRYLATSSDENVDELTDEFEEQGVTVTADYKEMIRWGLDAHGKDFVVAICLRTADHFACLKYAIEQGVKCILTDKPPVDDCGQFNEINTLAEANGCLVLVTFQHECNAPTDEMALRVAAHIVEHGAANVKVFAQFNQGWLDKGPDNWRIKVKWCGVLDIASHAARGACRVVGSHIAKVTKSVHSKGRQGGLEHPALDNGTVDVVFANGVRGEISYTQIDTRKADDILWMVELTNPKSGTVQKLLWRMEWGNAEVLYIGDETSTLDDIGSWTPHLRAHSEEFRAEVNDCHAKSPSGHMQGWSDMWYFFFVRAWRLFLSHCGYEELANHLITIAYGHCPDFKNAGKDAMLFVDMTVLAAEESREVTAEEICARHAGMTPASVPFTLAIPASATTAA